MTNNPDRGVWGVFYCFMEGFFLVAGCMYLCVGDIWLGIFYIALSCLTAVVGVCSWEKWWFMK